MSSQLYIGQVMHQRFFPMEYKFKYQVFNLKIDVDEIANEVNSVRWLSLNRFNLVSIHHKDYGSRSEQSWRAWFEEMASNYGITQSIKRIELVCMPRYLGFVFNPLAMWYGYDENNQLIAVIAEVSNTFGQWHHYVLTNAGEPFTSKISATAEKVFHVSPFLNMDCRYKFAIQQPKKTYQVGIYETENGKSVLNAIQVGKAQILNNKNLLSAILKLPFNTLKVMVLIHWWALKIWLKGGKFHKTPRHLQKVKHSHTEMNLC